MISRSQRCLEGQNSTQAFGLRCASRRWLSLCNLSLSSACHLRNCAAWSCITASNAQTRFFHAEHVIDLDVLTYSSWKFVSTAGHLCASSLRVSTLGQAAILRRIFCCWQGGFAAIKTALKEIDRDEVRGIGISGQQHGFVPLDEHGGVSHTELTAGLHLQAVAGS